MTYDLLMLIKARKTSTIQKFPERIGFASDLRTQDWEILSFGFASK
jgi:hypothetical protein